MSVWRLLGAAALALVLTASAMAFMTMSLPWVRERPWAGLVSSVVLFLLCVAGSAMALRRRK